MASPEQPPRWQPWLLAARPKTLWAGFAPVLIGTALAIAADAAHWPTALLCLLLAISVQVGTNYSNDYFDFVKGTDTEDRVGPTRAVQAGWVTPATMRRASMLAFGVTMFCAAILALRAGWFILPFGLVCVLAGILYTGGPFPLGYNGLGDLFAFVFFGPVAVVGTYYMQTLDCNWGIVIAGVAPGMFAVALICVNNLRDVDGDRLAGKRTLPVLLGVAFARAEYLIAIAAALLVPVVLMVRYGYSGWVLISLAVIALAIPALRLVLTRREGPPLNKCLGLTGKMELVHSLLFAIGIVL